MKVYYENYERTKKQLLSLIVLFSILELNFLIFNDNRSETNMLSMNPSMESVAIFEYTYITL